ncbi:MAG: YgiQ family radical SAM protein [Proteobacteria bacterium]|nr:YgiQ family radical SAM protein [Pseudomonadota bacterium]MBU1709236.1 YgiQ family radical SAM protein [Pseudomonadota bacterium]
MQNQTNQFIPASRAEMKQNKWDAVDIVLVTGDAYIDHPSFGVALIARWLEAHGYRVAILAQPEHNSSEDFKRFGRPALFFGITAGNLDSIVANYTGNAKVRDQDNYSPLGNPYFGDDKNKTRRRRPDRATIRYTNLAKAAYPDVPVILGGIEASLRRFIHFDYQQDKIRNSVLTDAKADLLVYGMGERAVLEIASRRSQGKSLAEIDGTCERLTDKEIELRTQNIDSVVLPGWQEIHADLPKFMAAEKLIDTYSRSLENISIIQKQQAMWVLQHPPPPPLDTQEMDFLYSLPYTRLPHPANKGNIPAYAMVRDSVTIVRGCYGNCSFCAISRHQGPIISTRSKMSIIKELEKIALSKDFKGTISDLGGPSANMYGTSCASPNPCKRHDCLNPGLCKHLRIDENQFLQLLSEATSVKGIKNVFISSGMRMELLLKTPKLLKKLISENTPGLMKIAPEHSQTEILRLMHKNGSTLLAEFLKTCRETAQAAHKTIGFSPYYIASHPGSTISDMEKLAISIQENGLTVKHFQDFTPTPGTLSTAMYVTGLDRDTLKPIFVPRHKRQRLAQRNILEKISLRNKSVRIKKTR